MSLFFRRFWPYLALSALAVVTAEPLARARMLCTDDGPFHLFRAVALGELLELGHWLPRWSPHMAQGYGYPFYNYYAPLSSYGVVALHWAGLAYPLALRAAFILGLWLAGVSACLFVAHLFGRRAGLAAGAAYLLAPYLAYDVLYRGNLAEAFAFVWPPLCLLLLQRVSQAGPTSLRWASLLALSYAALILTHNVFALIASPLILGYAALLTWEARGLRARVLAWSLAGLLAGVGLTAYFWLPALAERGLVHSDRLLVPPIFTWYTNFISARELLAPLPPFDPRLVNPSPARTIGLLTVLAGLPALAALLGRRGRARASTVLFFAAALAGYCLLTLEASAPVWRLLRPLELVQFPWRMLGPAALCAAVLVGASVAAVEAWLARRARAWARAAVGVPAALAVGAVFFGALPAWHGTYCPTEPDPTLGGLVLFEARTHTLGTTAKGEYLPRTAAGVPAETDLALALERSQEPDRLRLPEGSGARVLSADFSDPLDAAYEISTPNGAAVVYRQFYFPGWRVMVDGAPVAAGPAPQDGLIAFELPPGTHAVRVTFGATGARTAGGVLSVLTVVLWAALIAWRRMLRAANDQRPAQVDVWPSETPLPWAAVLVVLCAGLAALKLGVVDRLPPGPVEAGADAIRPQYAGAVHLAGGARLYGYELSATRLPGDGFIDVTWYAGMTEGSLRRWWPAVALEDADGQAWSVLNPLPPRWHREPRDTPEWGPGQYAQWARHVQPLPGTPPGAYTLYGWVFDRDNLEIASVLDEAGSPLAPRLALETITVTRPRRPYTLTPPNPAAQAFGPMALLGFGLDRTGAAAGETIGLALYWQSQAATTGDLLARLTLLDAAGAPALSMEVEPANGYPTSQWRAGDAWLGQHRVRLPAALPAGDYTLLVSVPGAGGAQARLTSLRVSAPERRFEPLPFDTASGAAFGDVGVLEGYSLARGEGQLRVALAWRAAGSPAAGYSVFVHLADAAGRVWAQSDAVPAGWTRPTTGWVAGEYVRDEHTLSLPRGLPAGDYTLWVGLYNPLTGARVPASGPGAAADARVAVGEVKLP